MTMRRVLLVGQDKGGSGKSLVVRALAESVVTARIVELEDEKRLVELEDRVDFFPVRADRSEIDRTSRAAARSEYDGVLDLMARKPAEGAVTPEPLIVDIGANASRSFLPEVASRAASYRRIGVEFALLTVITAEPGAASSAPVVLDLARPFARPLFVVENQIEGAVDAKILKALGKDVVQSRLAHLTLDPKANVPRQSERSCQRQSATHRWMAKQDGHLGCQARSRHRRWPERPGLTAEMPVLTLEERCNRMTRPL